MKKTIVYAVLLLLTALPVCAKNDNIKVLFLGTGAADWKGVPDANGDYRRLTSILVDDAVLVDFTPTDEDMIPEGCHPEVIFYTHSHGDHFNVNSGLKIGIKKVYCSDTWADICRSKYQKAAEEMGLQAPEVIGIAQQQEVAVGDLTFKALPGNHCSGNLQEQALIYLIIKGDKRVLYATDTAGIPANAAIGGKFGADGLRKENRLPLAGFIMEATVGMGGEENYRLFSHSCVETVLHTVRVLKNTGCLLEGAPTYITHLARTLHPSQAELNVSLPSPLKAAYDGLVLVF